MQTWDIYGFTSRKHPLIGVKCRGRLRKFAVANGIELLTENASDVENTVRFALPAGNPSEKVETFLRSLFDDVVVTKEASDVRNPVLSNLRINILDRYEISGDA